MIKTPFPYFGGKSRVAAAVWQRFGDVGNYVEPFFGSGAMLLGRPLPFNGLETVNDIDCFLANFWRATQADPDAVVDALDWPVNEADLHARHYWLVTEGAERLQRIIGNPRAYDTEVAGWWCWGMCAWIGGGFCSGKGPWSWDDGGGWAKRDGGMGVSGSLPSIGNGGSGVNRLCNGDRRAWLLEWFHQLRDRLRNVRVACGDWSRVMGPSVTMNHALNAVFLDPPYCHSTRDNKIYRCENDISRDVREWCLEHGDNPKLRIALCGYEGEHDLPGWPSYAWKAKGGYGSQGSGRGRANAGLERIWFSPHCLPVDEGLFREQLGERHAPGGAGVQEPECRGAHAPGAEQGSGALGLPISGGNGAVCEQLDV